MTLVWFFRTGRTKKGMLNRSVWVWRSKCDQKLLQTGGTVQTITFEVEIKPVKWNARAVWSFLYKLDLKTQQIIQEQRNCQEVENISTSWWRQRPQCQPHVRVSWITHLQGASALFYSSGRRITVKLLLSVGAAGRPISPIWSKNLLADRLYVCSGPHDRGSYSLHMSGRVIPPCLRYHRSAVISV